MKRYREYMNNIHASDTLRQRLKGLEAGGKRPIPWKRYGAMAAALALVLGLGGAGYAHYYNTVVNPTGDKFLEMTQAFDPAAHPDIAWEDPDETDLPGRKTLGNYEYHDVRGGVSVTVFCILPYIEYGDMGNTDVELDWDIPRNASRRELTREEIAALMGGEDVVNTHLDWGEYELTGWGAWYEDGSFWGAYIDGLLAYYGGLASQFQFAVTAGELPPTCIGFPESVTQEIRGITVTADKSDWEAHIFEWPSYIHERRVSFMKDGYGYRFEMSCGSGEAAEVLASRLVCSVADDRLALWTVDPKVETYTCPDCGQTVPVNTKHSHPHVGVDENGSPYTEPYDPNGDAPVAVSAAPKTYTCDTCGESVPVGGIHFHLNSNGDGTYTCDSCGATLPEGENHYHADVGMCAGYPVPPTPDPEESAIPEFDPDYDPAYEDGVSDPGPVESWEISDGHPLAPEGWTGPSGSGAVTDPGLTGSGELCGLPLAPEGWNGP